MEVMPVLCLLGVRDDPQILAAVIEPVAVDVVALPRIVTYGQAQAQNNAVHSVGVLPRIVLAATKDVRVADDIAVLVWDPPPPTKNFNVGGADQSCAEDDAFAAS